MKNKYPPPVMPVHSPLDSLITLSAKVYHTLVPLDHSLRRALDRKARKCRCQRFASPRRRTQNGAPISLCSVGVHRDSSLYYDVCRLARFITSSERQCTRRTVHVPGVGHTAARNFGLERSKAEPLAMRSAASLLIDSSCDACNFLKNEVLNSVKMLSLCHSRSR